MWVVLESCLSWDKIYLKGKNFCPDMACWQLCLYIYIFIILNNLHNIFKKSNSWENKVTIGLICANQE